MSQQEVTTGSARPAFESTLVAPKTIYGGGAVDYNPEEHIAGWLHGLESHLFQMGLHRALSVYCPRCANRFQTIDREVMRRNLEVLLSAELALFRLDGTFTVGTPIEMYLRMDQRPVGMGIWLDREIGSGLFVRQFARDGALLFYEREEVVAWLQAASR